MKKNSRTKRPKRNSGKQRRAHAPQITAQQVALLWRLLCEAKDIAQRIPSDEMQAVVQRLCGEFYALGSEALEAIRYALEVKKDARIGYQILNVLGVIPSPEERYAILNKPMATKEATPTPFPIAVAKPSPKTCAAGKAAPADRVREEEPAMASSQPTYAGKM
jgi:hypothetical protein